VTELAELIESAFRQQRAGDILMLALEPGRDDPGLLLRAAQHLRDLLAYSAVVEVATRLLELEPNHYEALELLALSHARLEPTADATPRALLARATEHGGGESAALLGRIHKQIWRAQWESAGASDETDRTKARRATATSSSAHLYRAVDAYLQAHAARTAREFWPGLNAVTLLSLVGDLCDPSDPIWPRAEIERTIGSVAATLASDLDAAASNPADDDALYWALVSRAELNVSQPGEDPRQILEDLRRALREVGPRLFVLDSTLQQFRMLSALGFRRELVDPARALLERAWAIALRPDRPRTRVVFSGHMIDRPDRPKPRFPAEHEPEVERALGDVAKALVRAHGDAIVYLSSAAGADILFAEACASEGIPYSVHLPFVEADFIESSVRPCGDAWVRRFDAVKRRALVDRDQVSDPAGAIIMPEHLGELCRGSPYATLNRWMLASARAYDAKHVVLVVLWDGQSQGDGPGGTAEMVDAVRKAGGRVIHVETPLAKNAPTTAALEPAAPPERELPLPPPMPEPARDASSLPAAPLLADTAPEWLEDLHDLIVREADAGEAGRWQRYRGDPVAWATIASLDLRFEPVQQLTPRTPMPALLGFEILGLDRAGHSYGYVLKEATTAGIDVTDLNLALFALGLEVVRQLRLLLWRRVSPEAADCARFFFTLNVNHQMLKTTALRVILDRYFDRTVADRILLELSENFPDGLKQAKSPSDQDAVIAAAATELRRLVRRHGVRLVLDDNNDLDAVVRSQVASALADVVAKTKTDAKYALRHFRNWAAERSSTARTLEELARFRLAGMPYVIEGVESQTELDFLRHHWPDDLEHTSMQGYAIRIPAALEAFFVPVEAGRVPKGYRLAEWVRERFRVV
jgi:EAL domain-containing protein (putative c-di-GMP-specific phosphodiesterase class I)